MHLGIILYRLVITLTDDVVTHQRVHCELSIVSISLRTMRSCLRRIRVYIKIQSVNYHLLRNVEILFLVNNIANTFLRNRLE